MKTFSLNFCHPVKGLIKFIRPVDRLCKVIPLDTEGSDVVEVSLEEFPSGKWLAFFEWEFEGREYVREEEIEL